jgi:DNA polymerase
MSDRDPTEELAELVAGFRTHLAWHARAGTHAAPGGASPAPQPVTPAAAAPAAPDAAAPAAPPVAAPAAQSPEVDPATAPRAARPTLAEVREHLGDCQRCKLAGRRKNIVFGVGDPRAALMFVGEAPGAEEDRRGEPFVGRAGQLLDKMIAAMGWTRESVYIANVLKCRPPGNRNPERDEVEACQPFLARQIDVIAPRVIVTLGKPAAHLLLDTNAPISALRGRFQSYRGITVMPTFHPAYLLRSPERKRDTWNDLKKVIAELARLGIDTPHPPKS